VRTTTFAAVSLLISVPVTCPRPAVDGSPLLYAVMMLEEVAAEILCLAVMELRAAAGLLALSDPGDHLCAASPRDKGGHIMRTAACSDTLARWPAGPAMRIGRAVP
jgi:hypothetical protein